MLLSIPNTYTRIAGCALFFTGSVFDWCDGLLARATGRTSLTGVVLDPWGTHAFSLAFRVGLAFYVAQHTDYRFFYLAPFVTFFLAADVKTLAAEMLFTKLVSGELVVNGQGDKNRHVKSRQGAAAQASDDVREFVGRHLKVISLLGTFPDHRARSLDAICAVIVMEQFFSFHLAWVAVVLFVLKDLARFTLHLFFVNRGGWVEDKVTSPDTAHSTKQ